MNNHVSAICKSVHYHIRADATSVPLYLKTWPKWLHVLLLALAWTMVTLFYLEYRRLRGDMIQVFKMVHNYYDVCAAIKLNFNAVSTTRGNKYKLQKNQAIIT